MTNLQLITSLIIYILSVVAALILTIITKKNGKFPLRILLLIHFSLLLLFMATYLSGFWSTATNLFFLFFFCTGILLSGSLINKSLNPFLRYYPILFLTSIIFFVFSPSLTIRFITFNWHTDHTGKWKLQSNYFMEEEKSMLSVSDSTTTYKITRQFGIFHKTLARNISFGMRLDSIRLNNFDEEKGIDVRGYYIRKTDTFEACDSMDISVPFVASKNTIIQKRKK